MKEIWNAPWEVLMKGKSESQIRKIKSPLIWGMVPCWESWASCLHLGRNFPPNFLPFEASEVMAGGGG